ncbi:hypothetical protein QQX98_010671 [Neonectria punicea]|uniref:Uncharacterized protein n=1 Tax=Neonectria punicea TaxID=979145 RepID=A0ABR1GPG4_9HYPO
MSTIIELPSRRDTLPPYYDVTEDHELDELDDVKTSSPADALPRYSAVFNHEAKSSTSSTPGFLATKTLQIQTKGQRLIAPPSAPRPDPIYIHAVTPAGAVDQAEYVSIRPARNSGSCFLARASDPDRKPVCGTTYLFGPGRPPTLRLAGGEDIELATRRVLSHGTRMRTPLGTFEWYYAMSRQERRAVGPHVDSLLVLERTTVVVLAGGKWEVRRRRVGQFVRGDGLRTEGTSRSSAGNGGRLMLDLREWADRKDELAQMEVLAVASCVAMLKKEVDRRRSHQSLVLMAAVGGGAC